MIRTHCSSACLGLSLTLDVATLSEVSGTETETEVFVFDAHVRRARIQQQPQPILLPNETLWQSRIPLHRLKSPEIH